MPTEPTELPLTLERQLELVCAELNAQEDARREAQGLPPLTGDERWQVLS